LSIYDTIKQEFKITHAEDCTALKKGLLMNIDLNTGTTLFAISVFFIVILAIAYQTYKLVKKDGPAL
jgi:hypothetical protein